MKVHTRVYFKYFGLGEQSEISCEICGKGGTADGSGFDLHHIIPKSQGGKDVIENLILLCRDHHNKAHDGRIHQDVFQARHDMFLKTHKDER